MGVLTSPPPRPVERPVDVKTLLAKARDELDATQALIHAWDETCSLHRLTREQGVAIARRLVSLINEAERG